MRLLSVPQEREADPSGKTGNSYVIKRKAQAQSVKTSLQEIQIQSLSFSAPLSSTTRSCSVYGVVCPGTEPLEANHLQ